MPIITCTSHVYSTISANDITIPFELKTMLLYEHKILLRNLGNHTLTITVLVVLNFYLVTIMI